MNAKMRKTVIEVANQRKDLTPGRLADLLNKRLHKQGKGQKLSASMIVDVLGEREAPPVKKRQKGGKSLQAFRERYDKDTIIPKKIEAALSALNGGWEYESEFVQRASLNYADLGNYRDKYADHVVHIKKESKRVWCGSVELAEQLKEMV